MEASPPSFHEFASGTTHALFLGLVIKTEVC